MTRVFLAVVILCVEFTSGAKAPDYIKPCPDFNSECVTATVQNVIPKLAKGIPEYGIRPFDPLEHDLITTELPGGLVVEIANGKMTGLRNCIIENVKLDRNSVDLNAHCNITIRGKYKATGRVLVVTINGDGDAKVKITHIFLNLKAKFKSVERDGETYTNVTSYAVKYNFKDESKVTFALTNLFKGNPEVGNAVLAFLNTNWRQVANEFGTPVINTIGGLLHERVKEFFAVIPQKELFGF